MEKDISNVVRFPVVNRRHDVSNIGVDPEEIAEKIRLMKMAYFSEVAANIVNDTMRSIAMLGLDETDAETHELESRDIILIKETVISALCRIVGLSHPLHEIGDENIIIGEMIEDYEASMLKYRFKSEPDPDTEGNTFEFTLE